jgi:hypothetical protein
MNRPEFSDFDLRSAGFERPTPPQAAGSSTTWLVPERLRSNRLPPAVTGKRPWSLSAGLLLLLLSACGNLFEDNGTHLAYTLEKGAAQLRASAEPELVVRYETLDGGADPYYIEITPSFVAGRSSNIPGSYLVVSGKTRGGTSYHNRFVLVPQRLYIEKSAGGPAELVLRRDGGSVNVVELR